MSFSVVPAGAGTPGQEVPAGLRAVPAFAGTMGTAL
jgi:hypothetical protein